MVHGRTRVLWMLAAVLAAAPACEEKKPAPPPETKSSRDGGPELPPGVDKNIAEAITAVAGGAAAQGGPAGPPPTGVFAPGAADREVKVGDFPKVSLGGKGSGPTVTFSTPVLKKREATTEIAVQIGPQSAMPTVDLMLSIEANAPRDTAAAPAGPVEVLVKVNGAKLAQQQPGQIPPGVAAQIAKLKGARLRFEVQPNGAGRPLGFEVPKDADEGLGQIARSAGDALALEFLPYPTEPVGVGGFWMVASREGFMGLDVVSYRMIKVEKIDGDRVTLSVNTRRYTAGGQIGLAGIPPHQVVEFNGNTNGQVVVSAKDPMALSGEVADVLIAGLVPQGGAAPQGQKLGIQLQVRTALEVRGGG